LVYVIGCGFHLYDGGICTSKSLSYSDDFISFVPTLDINGAAILPAGEIFDKPL